MIYLRHLRYVFAHRWYVFLECCRLGVPWRGLVHDLSKFLPDEWIPYARYFYGPQPPDERARRAFDIAWAMHQHRNRHHWQHWFVRCDDENRTIILPMPKKYVREMLADWRGAGRAKGRKDTASWYAARRSLIVLAPESRELLHRLMTSEERGE